MNPQTKNTLISASVLSIITTVIVLCNTPTRQDTTPNNKASNIVRTFILTFIACAFVLYVMQDNDSNAMMTNIIQGKPDF